MTATASKPRSIFGHQLRGELDRAKAAGKEVTVRELARRIHKGNPKKWSSPESVRRSIARWMTSSPSDENRRECAVALGLDPSHFGTSEDDDEEAELFSTITDALHALVRHEVRRQQAERVGA